MIHTVYILASQKRGTLYIGVTNDIARRAFEHRKGAEDGFTGRYGVKRLVHMEVFEDITKAIAREKRLKAWNRDRKIALVEKDNPDWDDLFLRLNG